MFEELAAIAPSVISSLIVGMGAAWLAAQKAMATYQVRLTTVEEAVRRIEASDRDATERLVRLETKIDLLLAGKLKEHQENQ